MKSVLSVIIIFLCKIKDDIRNKTFNTVKIRVIKELNEYKVPNVIPNNNAIVI